MKSGTPKNVLHTLLLLGAMCALVLSIGWVAAGPVGVIWAAVGSLALLVLSPGLPPRVVLRLTRARPLLPADYPGLQEMVAGLAARASLPRVPAVYVLPGGQMNALSLGSRREPVIALTPELLRGLDGRELAGVLAHEISHIHNNDLGLMAVSGSVGRMVDVFAMLGQVLFLVNLPLTLMGAPMPWAPILLLLAAPLVSTLLQLALSRSREFEADLEAVRLTGDPRGLASALVRLESHQRWLWRRLLLPAAAYRLPGLLRSHPHSEERVRRLEKMNPQTPGPSPRPPSGQVFPGGFFPRGPRMHPLMRW